MKKSLALLSSLIFMLSACSNDLSTPAISDIQNVEQIQSFANDDAEAQKIINENKEELQAISQRLFMQYYADDAEVVLPSTKLKNSSAPITKGGVFFNILNKSKVAQKLAYLISDYPVRAKFNAHGISDSTPRITPQEIAKLKSILKPGDLILCGNDDSFIHAIVYFGNDLIIHALASKVKGPQKMLGVVKETLTQYLTRASRDKFVVLRYRNLNTADLPKVRSYAESQVGKGYDTLFLINSDERFYCTELVYKSIMQLSNPPRIYPHKEKLGWQIITNEDFMDSPDLETIWTFNKKRPAVGELHPYNN